MKANMGSTDKMVRLIVAALIAILYFTNVISGTLGIVLLVLATEEASPLYGPDRAGLTMENVGTGVVRAELRLGQVGVAGLDADPKSDSTQFLNAKIKLLSVDPYPINADGPIPLEEYKIKLVVTSL